MNTDDLANALISGFRSVIAQQEYLNRINVFPVADSDTGTNLSLSLSSALVIVDNNKEKHVGPMLVSLADAMLDGARGNSGAIFAQFFQGISDSAGELTYFTTDTFRDAINLGSEYAHDALSNPREGTVLSVIQAFAKSITQLTSENPEAEFIDVISKAQAIVEKALTETPKQLNILKKAGVVDAGAKGFALLIGGMSDYLQNGVIKPMPEMALLNEVESGIEISTDNTSSQFRFCTECLVTASDIDRRKLREALAGLGDSIVLAGSKHKAKIHIHVDNPDTVFGVARQFGEISGKKADDMHRQQSAAHNSSKSFVVITDSGADISDEDIERLDIHMVPCRIQFGNQGYLDKVSISSAEFYAELKNNPHHPTTSQPSPGDFRRQFQFLASHFENVLSITLSSNASGAYEGAKLAAKRSKAPGYIHVVDSLNASIGQGQLTILAAECAAAGISIDKTLKILEREIPQTKTFALLYDLSYAVRGGRLPQWIKLIADLLRVTPIIYIKANGQLGLATCLLGRGNRIRRYAKFISSHYKDNENLQIGIGHAICSKDAEELAKQLRNNIESIDELKICELGPGLGAHGGPGTLIVSTRSAISDDGLTSGPN
ncbi:MAG: DegV family protein [Woeseiaceae bacterium]|nr:DegV family protein [Woeseiaceae bacterium]